MLRSADFRAVLGWDGMGWSLGGGCYVGEDGR